MKPREEHRQQGGPWAERVDDDVFVIGMRAAAECSQAVHTSKVSCEEPHGAPAPTCVPTCTTASDCVIPGSGKLGDVHHYACRAGRCQWLGCRSTQECRTAMSSNSYVCE